MCIVLMRINRVYRCITMFIKFLIDGFKQNGKYHVIWLQFAAGEVIVDHVTIQRFVSNVKTINPQGFVNKTKLKYSCVGVKLFVFGVNTSDIVWLLWIYWWQYKNVKYVVRPFVRVW